MPNTPTVAQVLPNFISAKNGATANDLRTNNGFNQILKNEVANKIKKTPVNNTKQLATDQVAHEALSLKKSAVNKEASQPENAPSSTSKESKELENINLSIIDETNTLLNFVGDLNSFVRPTDINSNKIDDALTESEEELNASLDGNNATALESTLASNNIPVKLSVTEPNLNKSVKENSIKSSDITIAPDYVKINNEQLAANTLSEAATKSSSSTTLTATTTTSNLISSFTEIDMKSKIDDKNKKLGVATGEFDAKTQADSAAADEMLISKKPSHTDLVNQEQLISSNHASGNSIVALGNQLDQSAQSDLTVKPAPMLESANSNIIELTSAPATKSIQVTPITSKEVAISDVNRQNTTIVVDDINKKTTVFADAISSPPIDSNKNLIQAALLAKQTSEVNTKAVEPAPVLESANSNKRELTSAPATGSVQETSEEVATNAVNRQINIVAVDDINKGTTLIDDTASPPAIDANKNLMQAAPLAKQRSEVNTKTLTSAPVPESADSNIIELTTEPAAKSVQETSVSIEEVATSGVKHQNNTVVMDDINKGTTASDNAMSPPPIDSNKNLMQASTLEKPTLGINTPQLESVAIAARVLPAKTKPTPADDFNVNNKTSSRNRSTEQISDQTVEEYRPELSVNEHSVSDKFSTALKTQLHETQQENLAQENKEQKEFKIADVQRAEPSHATPPLQVTVEAASVSAASNFIGSRVGSKAWDQAVGQKIVWMVAGGEQSAQLTLNPPDLGPIQIVLSISDNQVDASFVSSHLDVREAIEAAAPKLREMMDNAGMSLSGFSVNAQSTPSGSEFSSNSNSRHGDTNQRQIRSADTDHSGSVVPTTARTSAPLGLVDTFV